MRPYAIVGELLLSDGTTYTRLATDEAPDMEEALRRAATVVGRWRGEQLADHPHATVRAVIEVQVGADDAAPGRASDGTQDEEESEQSEEEPPRFPHEQGSALLFGRVALGGIIIESGAHRHALSAMMFIIRVLINRRRCDRKPAPWAHGRYCRDIGKTDPGIAAADGIIAGEVRGAGGAGPDVLRGDRAGRAQPVGEAARENRHRAGSADRRIIHRVRARARAR